MRKLKLTIDGIPVEAEEGMSILQAAHKAGIYIPALCCHPDLPSFEAATSHQAVYQDRIRFEGTITNGYQGCQLCLVKIEGIDGLQTSCTTPVTDGMVVHVNTDEIRSTRQVNLTTILATHPHACIVCPQKEGCDLKQCTMNVPEEERCCWKFPFCELRKVAEYVGLEKGIPRYVPRGSPTVEKEPLFKRDYELCIGCLRCVRACNNLRGVDALGYTMVDGKVIVGFVAPTAAESGCRFCGACVEVCPTGALCDKDIKWAERETALTPCRTACPAKVDIPQYVRLIAEEKFSEAIAVIREKIPLPGVLGHVCTHPCEDVCRRKEIDEPLSIAALKRFAREHDSGLWKANLKTKTPSGKEVAIVGSGPAGLTAAYYLAKRGHKVTVFEALSEPGGMIRVGIPEYILPQQVLNEETKEIEDIGVNIKTNCRVESLEEFFAQGYSAIFLAIGAHKDLELGVEGKDEPGVIGAVPFLRKVNLEGAKSSREANIGSKVTVIGGGNSAIDASRTSLRLGAKKVTIFYRRTREEMPASPEEIEEALHEGVEIIFLAAPNKIIREEGKLKLECFRTRLGEPDASGRRRPEPIPNSEFSSEFDTIIAAIGQMPDIPPGLNLHLDKSNRIQIDPKTLSTSSEGVFAGGDVVTGPASVIEAIAMGREAATSIDKYLGGDGIIEEKLIDLEEINPWLGQDKGFAGRHRVEIPSLPLEERIGGFSVAKLGFGKEQAIEEARRCLRCDLRLQISSPILPPEEWINLCPDNLDLIPEVEGVYELLDGEKNVVLIKGAANLRKGLEEQLGFEEAKYFIYEKEPMYTRRESELLQQFIQQHGRLPKGNLGLEEELF